MNKLIYIIIIILSSHCNLFAQSATASAKISATIVTSIGAEFSSNGGNDNLSKPVSSKNKINKSSSLNVIGNSLVYDITVQKNDDNKSSLKNTLKNSNTSEDYAARDSRERITINFN